MSKSYVEVEILADPSLAEALTGILAQLGFEGFWEDGSALRAYMRADRWSPALLDEIRTVAGLVSWSSASTAPTISVREIAGRNWNEEWEKTIRPIRVTERIMITPTWHAVNPVPGRIVVTIDPKMSFGTGYHESTRLVLRLMDGAVRPGTTILDVGTGTGVLAIAGVKLGASSAVAVDVDDWSYDNALENAGLNGVTDRVRVIHGDISAAPNNLFDMIVANIQRNIIEPILGEMLSRLAPNGLIILSGLLQADEEPILEALGAHCLLVRQRLFEREWLALAAGRAR
jgi:ribosomal protein L11 methyltransferase